MHEKRSSIPTALSSMMPWALVVAADMAAGLVPEPKNLRRNEMVNSGVNVEVVFVERTLWQMRSIDFMFEEYM